MVNDTYSLPRALALPEMETYRRTWGTYEDHKQATLIPASGHGMYRCLNKWGVNITLRI
jgi:hypothetical protein